MRRPAAHGGKLPNSDLSRARPRRTEIRSAGRPARCRCRTAVFRTGESMGGSWVSPFVSCTRPPKTYGTRRYALIGVGAAQQLKLDELPLSESFSRIAHIRNTERTVDIQFLVKRISAACDRCSFASPAALSGNACASFARATNHARKRLRAQPAVGITPELRRQEITLSQHSAPRATHLVCLAVGSFAPHWRSSSS